MLNVTHSKVCRIGFLERSISRHEASGYKFTLFDLLTLAGCAGALRAPAQPVLHCALPRGPRPTPVCYNTMLQYYATILCYNPMLQSYATILCYNTMLQYYATILCCDTILQSYATILCCNTMLQNYAPPGDLLFANPAAVIVYGRKPKVPRGVSYSKILLLS